MYQECINYHVRNVRNEKTGELLSEGTQELRAKELKEFCEFVTQPLTAENLEITLADYEQFISSKLNKDTIKRRIKNARKFVEAITKGDIIMNDNATENQGQDLAGAFTELDEQPNTDIQEPQTLTVNAPETKRPVGRPKNTSSQDKKFFNLQIPPDMRNNLDILAMYDECSITDIILTAIAEYINVRNEDIQYQIEYVQRKKERNARRYTQ